jgi:hypothetical protein
MAFTHGKNAQFALRNAAGYWQDMTAYTSEVALPGKAGIAETTVFGRGAKTYIGGLLEGTLTMKGFFDPTVTATNAAGNGPDEVLAGLLGTQPVVGLTVVAAVTTQSNYGQFILCPSGSSSGIALLGDLVITDYQISAPVSGVVAFNATFQLSGATTATATLNGGVTTGAYGLQVIRAANSVVFNAAWEITGGGGAGVGAASYSALMGTNK